MSVGNECSVTTHPATSKFSLSKAKSNLANHSYWNKTNKLAPASDSNPLNWSKSQPSSRGIHTFTTDILFYSKKQRQNVHLNARDELSLIMAVCDSIPHLPDQIFVAER